MLFDADVYDLKSNHECHELLSVGEGGACGDFLTQTVRQPEAWDSSSPPLTGAETAIWPRGHQRKCDRGALISRVWTLEAGLNKKKKQLLHLFVGLKCSEELNDVSWSSGKFLTVAWSPPTSDHTGFIKATVSSSHLTLPVSPQKVKVFSSVIN